MRELTKKFIPKYTLIIIFIGFLIYLFSENNENYNKELKYREKYPIQYTRRLNNEEYERECEETTERELQKLYNSQKFLQMYSEKGVDKSNWCWQTSEKKKKKNWNDRDSDIKSEELENLTFSVSI